MPLSSQKGDIMLNKTLKAKERFDELTELIMKPEIIADNRQWKKLVKERSGLEELVTVRDEYERVVNTLSANEESLKTETDAEMIALYKEENQDLKKQKTELEEKLQILLLPKDEDDDKDCIIEIRGAAGGEESALFASVLMNMYILVLQNNGCLKHLQFLSASQSYQCG